MHHLLPAKTSLRADPDHPEFTTPRRRFCKGLISGRKLTITLSLQDFASRASSPDKTLRLFV